MKLIYVPGNLNKQGRAKNFRMFTANGTELKGLASFSLYMDAPVVFRESNKTVRRKAMRGSVDITLLDVQVVEQLSPPKRKQRV